MITIPDKSFICQVQLANMVSKLCPSLEQMSNEANEEEDGSWILERLVISGLQ